MTSAAPPTRRPATRADLDDAAEVVGEGLGPWLDPPLDAATLRQGVAERLVGAEVLLVDGRFVGWMRVLELPGRLALDQLFLAPPFRGRGLGERLVREVLERAGPRPVELRVLKANPALRLYLRLGFRVDRDAGLQWHLLREPGWTGPLPLAADEEPGADRLAAVLARCGRPGPAEPLPSPGSANRAYRVGDAVLRVGRATPDGLSDARTEAAAVPVAVASGIRTPPLLAFDETGRDVPTPWTLYRWVEGELAVDAPAGVWREVGRELARIHALGRVPDGAGWLDRHTLPDLPALLPHAAALDPSLPARLECWLATLECEEVPPRFLHGDLHARNVLVRGGELAAILDWGDAGWGDPALDFEPMPTRHLGAALAGYREAGGGAGDPTLEDRAWRATLAVALVRIARPKPHRRPTARLEELLACLPA